MQQKLVVRTLHLFRHVINESFLSLATEFPPLLLQRCEPVEHGFLAAGLQGHYPTITSDLKLMLTEVLHVISQCGR